MYIDFAELSHSQVYFTMIQTVIPRPIAWVLSENPKGRFNLAPFSYFNAVCSDPPLLMISIGKKPDGSFKDTRVNIEQRREFVVHIAHEGMLDALNESSATLSADVSEIDRQELATRPLPGSRLPRLADCRVAISCECYQIQEIGGIPQTLIFGLIKGIYVDDAIISGDTKSRVKVHADQLSPIGRLGANEYVNFGKIVRRKRPA